MSGQQDDRPWPSAGDQPQDGPQDAPMGGAILPDPTAIPSASPYAVTGPSAYGTADDAYRAAAVVPPREHRGLSRRNAKLITSLSPFAALILFFVLMNVAGGPPAWLAFLLIPIAGVVTEHLRGDKGDDGDRDRRRS